jgi:hypothetical protein
MCRIELITVPDLAAMNRIVRETGQRCPTILGNPEGLESHGCKAFGLERHLEWVFPGGDAAGYYCLRPPA